MEDKIDPDESTYRHTADELLAPRPFSPTVTQIPRTRRADAAAPSQPLPHPALSHWCRSHLGTLGQDDRRCARLAHREPFRGSDTLRDYRRAFVTSSFRQLGRVASSDCKRALAASSPAHPPAHVDAPLSGATRASALYRAVPAGCGAPIRVQAHRLRRHLARVAPRAYTPHHHHAHRTALGHHRRGPCRSTPSPRYIMPELRQPRPCTRPRQSHHFQQHQQRQGTLQGTIAPAISLPPPWRVAPARQRDPCLHVLPFVSHPRVMWRGIVGDGDGNGDGD